ncbi:ABC transporter substrate-binding protein [Streptomyces sp. NBC_01500]|uniref:ABC transporter substrate-binding protein n=1 Tax=Streptomyces sp. NBC_01500 TaxID=2903886 RepID=UPI00224D099E|nr:ABC transporter substrate-binding protein [Streptomyces sp. NBC_01500]MCX4552078.1 ABC transporter substrate-binding protein [Streptomyces sp. NBC_01500]
MNRKTLVLPAIAGLLTPVLAACGSTDSGGGGGKPIVVGITDSFVATKKAPAPLDPAYTYDTGAWNILRPTLQSLMQMPRGGGLPIPDAASGCRFTDSENESYRCKLRSGLEFSNGHRLTAADVKYSLDRVTHIHDPNGPAGLFDNIDTIEPVSDRELVFHLKTPDATFPYKLATPAAGIVEKAAYAPNKLRDGFEIDGSGPYTFKAEVRNNRLEKAVFTKNPRYKGALKLQNDKVEIRSFTGAAAMGAALKSGKVDMMTRAISPEQIKEFSAGSSPDINFVESQGLEIRYLGFNTNDPSVKNKAVRQAMAALVDRGQIASQVYGATAEPLYSLIPTSVGGHTNSFFNKYGDPSRAEATRILRNAGITDKVRLTLHYTNDHYGPNTAKEFALLKKQLNASGLFDITIQGTQWDQFRPAELHGDYAVYGMGWFPDFPDADNFISPFLSKGNFLNLPYANSTIRDKYILDSRRASDRTTAVIPLQKIQDIVADDVPVLPLWQGKQYVAARDDLTGVEWALSNSSALQIWELGRGIS